MSLDAELLDQSFAKIRDRQTEFTSYFYSQLFEDYPQVKPLFAHTSMDLQAKKLFASLALVVDSLKDPDTLTKPLKGLGARHIQYGVLPEHYPFVGRALLKTLQFMLKEAWTPNVEQAWIAAYTAVTKIMLTGADNDSADRPPVPHLKNTPA